MTVPCGAEGTSSGNKLTVVAPTSSTEVLAATDEWLSTEFCCPPQCQQEPSPLPDAAREHSMSVPNKSVLQEEDDGIPAARITLFAPERLHLKWERNVCEGAGLQNLGNTCFLNATLQCLTYTPPLANYLLLQEHSRTCKRSDFCLMCLMESHVISTFNNSIGIIQPILITRNLTRIAKHLRFGEQEDAHEFLRYMVDAMQLSCLYDHSELDRYTEATTLIYQIFGGYLRSRVECMQCLGTSITYETCLDIALQINNSSDLVEAFREFVKMETLDDYTCGTCCRKVKATKKLTLHRLPNVLTISIKRYSYFGTKISRDITYPEHLDVQPFMSKSPGEPVIYILYSVLVHAGTDCDIGHYYCYNKISDGNWYCMNDSLVRRVDTGVVMNEQAYMLFYIRCPELSAIPADSYRPLGQATAAAAYRAALKKRARPALDTPGPVSGPQLPCHVAKKLEVPKLSDRFNGSNGSGNCNGNGRSSSIGMGNIISSSSNNNNSSSSNGRAVNGIAGKQAVNIKSNGSSSVRQRKRHNGKRPPPPLPKPLACAAAQVQLKPPNPAAFVRNPTCPGQPFPQRLRAELKSACDTNGAAFAAAGGASARPTNGASNGGEAAASTRPDGATEAASPLSTGAAAAAPALAASSLGVQFKHSGNLQLDKLLNKESIREYARLKPGSSSSCEGGVTAHANFTAPSQHRGFFSSSKLVFRNDHRNQLTSLVPYAPGESSEESETEIVTKMTEESANLHSRLDGGRRCAAASGVAAASGEGSATSLASVNEGGAGDSGGRPGTAGEGCVRQATIPSCAAVNGNKERAAAGDLLADAEEIKKVFIAEGGVTDPPKTSDQKSTSGASWNVGAQQLPTCKENGGGHSSSEGSGHASVPPPPNPTSPSLAAKPKDSPQVARLKLPPLDHRTQFHWERWTSGSAHALTMPCVLGASNGAAECPLESLSGKTEDPAPPVKKPADEVATYDSRCLQGQRDGGEGVQELRAPHLRESYDGSGCRRLGSRSRSSSGSSSRSSSRSSSGSSSGSSSRSSSRRRSKMRRVDMSPRSARWHVGNGDHSNPPHRRGSRRPSDSRYRQSPSNQRYRRSPSSHRHRRSYSSQHHRRRSRSSRRRSPSNRHRSPINRRRSRNSRRRSPSNRRRSPSNCRRSPSNRRRSHSNRRRSPSNRRRSPSNRRRSPSNRRRSSSHRRSPSNRHRSPSSHRRSLSNRRRSPSSHRRSSSHRRRHHHHRRSRSSHRHRRSASRHSRRRSRSVVSCARDARDSNRRWRRGGERSPSAAGRRHRTERQHWATGRHRTCHS